jgi:hypothetical protein
LLTVLTNRKRRSLPGTKRACQSPAVASLAIDATAYLLGRIYGEDAAAEIAPLIE